MRRIAWWIGCGVLFLCVGNVQTLSAQTVTDTISASVSATVSSLPTIDPGPGGTGGTRTGVRFTGLAYPNATVTLLRAGSVVATTVADVQGRFTFLFTDVRDAIRIFFAMYATDTEGRRSTLLNFPTVLYTGSLTDITGIRFAPTITTDKVAIKQGDFINVFGMALPSMSIEINFEGFQGRTFSLSSDNAGRYRLVSPITLPFGEYIVRSRYIGDSRTSQVLRIIVGPASINRVETSVNIPGDCNVDQKVTLVDFSVLAYWFGKRNPPACVDTNKDGVINLVDFSILAFYWNG